MLLASGVLLELLPALTALLQNGLLRQDRLLLEIVLLPFVPLDTSVPVPPKPHVLLESTLLLVPALVPIVWLESGVILERLLPAACLRFVSKAVLAPLPPEPRVPDKIGLLQDPPLVL